MRPEASPSMLPRSRFSFRALGPHLFGFPLQFGGKLHDAPMMLLQVGDELLALAQGKPDAFDLQIRDHICAAMLPAHPEIDVRFRSFLAVNNDVDDHIAGRT